MKPPAILIHRHAPAATILIRMIVGGVFLSEGIQKFLFPDALGVGRFIKIGIPYPEIMAPFVGVFEIGCGAFLLLGLLTRLAALPIIVTMLVAIAEVHGKNGFMGVPVEGHPGAMYAGYMLNLVLIAMSVALILTGAGLLSVDALIFKRGLWARGPQPLDQPERRG